MSRENTPTDNAIAERFIRTFKQHQINGKTVEQMVQEVIITNPKIASKSYRNIVNNFIKSINQKPNKKSILKRPERHDKDVSNASTFMREPYSFYKSFLNLILFLLT
jgi:hypothetical protein